MAYLSNKVRSSHPTALVRPACSVLPWDPIPDFLRKNNAILTHAALVQFVFLTLLTCLYLGIPAVAQTDVNDVHIQPREVAKPADATPTPKPDLVTSNPDLMSSATPTATSGLSARVRPLKVDVDLVLVPVTITDPMNRLVTGLGKRKLPALRGQFFAGNPLLLQRRCSCLSRRDFRLQRQHE